MLALWMNLTPRAVNPAEYYWLKEGLGWDAVPVGGTLHGVLLWQGIEVAIFAPGRGQTGPSKARAAANLLSSWLRVGKLVSPDELHGEQAEADYLILGPSELVRITGALATDLGVGANHTDWVGEYWLALMRDLVLLRRGEAPHFVKFTELARPLRVPARANCAPLLEKVRAQAGGNALEGAPSSEDILQAELSLPPRDRAILVEAARHIPMADPSPSPAQPDP